MRDGRHLAPNGVGRPSSFVVYSTQAPVRRWISLDLDAVERALFEADGPAYRLMEAMVSVKEREGWDGYRGAPRLVLVLLERVDEISKVAPGTRLYGQSWQLMMASARLTNPA
jgi:hypothetical protein